jgi:hypothetical protein
MSKIIEINRKHDVVQIVLNPCLSFFGICLVRNIDGCLYHQNEKKLYHIGQIWFKVKWCNEG